MSLLALWYLVTVAFLSDAAILQGISDESLEEDNSVALGKSVHVDATSNENEDRQSKYINWAPFPVSYHISSGVPAVQPFTYHVPGAVYSIPSPVAALPQTPASTVLLPMYGQTSGAAGGARSDGELFKASARGNMFTTCAWIFSQCVGLGGRRARSLSAPDVTPAYFRYGYGPVPSVQYPINVGAEAGMPVATPYGRQFWCGIFSWKCLPDLSSFPASFQENIRNAFAPTS